ncbi:MAG TPA: type II secretion system F family protein [Burkholderiales bacterium]|nr:type II secretion system F family protein [Burkholderiales bacterium]
MALFTYKAIDTRGKTMLGQIEAVNIVDLEQRLKRMGLDLIRGGPARAGGAWLRVGSIKRAELINFCFHMEQLTGAGVPLIESLIDLRDSIDNARFREVISGVIESIQGGLRLSQALTQYPQIFTPVFTSLVRAGEDTGKLPAVLKSLVESLKWEDELAEHVKKLVMYPAFVGSIVIIVTLFLMVYLVPQMVAFIKNMGQQIPLQTRILIEVSAFMVNYWWAVLVTPLIVVAGVVAAARVNPSARYQLDRLKLAVPVSGEILRKIILSRFASIFALMYASGITILEAIRSSEETAGNVVIQEGLRLAGQQIGEGKNVTAAFQEVGLFPPLVLRMLRVGESTGALDTALLNVSYFYNREVRESIAKIQVLIEPALTVFLGVILGWVMLSVLGPIYDVITKLKF